MRALKQLAGGSFWRFLLFVFLVIYFLGVSFTAGFAQNVSPEYRSKAAYLNKIPGFVQWPDTPQLPFQGDSAFRLCVYGDYSFGFTLAQVAGETRVAGRPIRVHWIHKEQELRSCHLIFVSRSEAKHYERILDAVKGSNSLTVGETSGFLEAGGMLELQFENNGLWIAINLVAVQRAGLKMDARLLALAKRVVTAQEIPGK
jgi:YfiR/HmsC-like